MLHMSMINELYTHTNGSLTPFIRIYGLMSMRIHPIRKNTSSLILFFVKWSVLFMTPTQSKVSTAQTNETVQKFLKRQGTRSVYLFTSSRSLLYESIIILQSQDKYLPVRTPICDRQ